jgi:hypothetical protein
MYITMNPLPSSNSYSFRAPSAKGGLIQVLSGGTSKTQTALLESTQAIKTKQSYFLWIADEGVLYPEVVHQEWDIPLSHLLFVKAAEPKEVWKTALDAAQTGLFQTIFVRPSQACPTAHLRKLQLIAEKQKCSIFLLTPFAVPHWMLKKTIGPVAGQPFPTIRTDAHSLSPQH